MSIVAILAIVCDLSPCERDKRYTIDCAVGGRDGNGWRPTNSTLISTFVRNRLAAKNRFAPHDMVALSSSGETSLVLGYSSGSRARKYSGFYIFFASRRPHVNRYVAGILRIYGGRISVASSWGWTEARVESPLPCIGLEFDLHPHLPWYRVQGW
jgi:hypothetical protein